MVEEHARAQPAVPYYRDAWQDGSPSALCLPFRSASSLRQYAANSATPPVPSFAAISVLLIWEPAQKPHKKRPKTTLPVENPHEIRLKMLCTRPALV